MTTPRAFIVRHGETEWSLNGRHTGTTELPLTSNGEARIKATGRALVGDDRLIVPRRVAHIYVSPRHRARRTLELLDIGCRERFPWHPPPSSSSAEQPPDPTCISSSIRSEAKITVTDAIREWDYGDYEGLTSAQIRARRREEGLNEDWDIWRDGCPGGEGPADVTKRLDGLITDIRGKYHGAVIGKPKGAEGTDTPDVLLVAHGHILRAFAMRWIGRELTDGVSLLLEAGGVGTLSYEHHSIHEPAILLGGAFTV